MLTTFTMLSSSFLFSPLSSPSFAEDELAKYAQEGNKVGVDGGCFMNKCSLPSSACAKDMNCLKGLQCLSKCKGEGTCSTSCFAKYGSPTLDKFLHCAIEEQNCVNVPKDETRATWLDPEKNERQIPPLSTFKMESLEGTWYKVMGMDARYDCFDCQVNKFSIKQVKDSNSNNDNDNGANSSNGVVSVVEKKPKPKQDQSSSGTSSTVSGDEEDNENKVIIADVSFRMPRQRDPGYGEFNIVEDLIGDSQKARRSMHSVGEMFGLTFWENWSVIGEGGEGDGEWKFIYYNGHTLQGNYEGAFVYSRSTSLSPTVLPDVYKVARANKLDPTKFCKIRNTCFLDNSKNNNNNRDSVGDKETNMKRAASSNSEAEAIRDLLATTKTTKVDDDSLNIVTRTFNFDDQITTSDSLTSTTTATTTKSWFQKFVTMYQNIGLEVREWLEDPQKTSNWLLDQQELMGDSETPPYADLLGGGEEVGYILRDK